jgi:hypothetical protein
MKASTHGAQQGFVLFTYGHQAAQALNLINGLECDSFAYTIHKGDTAAFPCRGRCGVRVSRWTHAPRKVNGVRLCFLVK